METKAYKTGDLPAGVLEGLLARVYADSPAYAAALAEELSRQLSPDNPFLSRGSREGFVVTDGARPAAHACAVTDPRLPPGAGLIGYFEADGPAAARLVLDAACAALASRGVRRVYGPVNDTVWQRYGVSTGGPPPPYLGEPFTPADYAAYFEAAGFVPADRRLTAAVDAEGSPFGSYASARAGLEAKGFSFVDLDEAGLSARAADLHGLAAEVFSGSPLFVPAGLDEFLYMAGARAAGSAAVLAEDAEGRPAGFLWGMPDGLSAGDNFVFKTVAVLPAYRGLGLGRALFWSLASRARAKRYILSTMRYGNAGITALAPGGAEPLREYLTFRRELC